MRFITILIISLLAAAQGISQSKRKYEFPTGTNASNWYPNLIIVKTKDNSQSSVTRTSTSNLNIDQIAQRINAKKHQSFVKQSKIAQNARVASNPLSNIFKIELKEGQDLIQTINQLLEFEEVVYAEPYYIFQPLNVPDDPQANAGTGAQSHLDVIKAYDAWDIEKGDSSILIGIVDTGVQLDHEDLRDNIYLNLLDPINQIDDDMDGLIDNYYGWDFADNDSDPTSDQNQHGNLVAGVSSARTNNGIGLAGTGFNTKFMPVKAFSSQGNAFKGYEAMVYAAENGCKVINLSWGAPNAKTKLGQEIINYIVFEKDVVVVAAAGNTPENVDFYPASYDNVLSVGASDNLDQKAFFSTYSPYVDLLAPGVDIYTAKMGNAYGRDSGTSLSSPMVAGAAALVRARFPELNALQVMEKIRVNTDDIYQLDANKNFKGLLGKGRLNMVKPLTDNLSSALRMTKFEFGNNFGNYAFFGDSVTISATFVNYLSPTLNASVTLSTISNQVTIVDSVFHIGQLGTLDSINNNHQAFKIFIDPQTPPETKLVFRLNYKDNFYTDYQYFEFFTSPPFLTVDNNQMALTVSSNGNLGYYKYGFRDGVGVTLNNTNILDQIGFMVGNSEENLASNAVKYVNYGTRDKDFTTRSDVKFYDNSQSDIDARAVYEVNNGSVPDLPLLIEQKTLSVIKTGSFIILEYRIINKSTQSIDSLRAGLYMDWDLDDHNANSAGWSNDDLLGFVHNTDKTLYAGAALLNDFEPVYNAYDKADLNGNIADLGSKFDKSQKFAALLKGIDNTEAGMEGPGNDVSHLIGANLVSLDPNQSIKLTFALVSGADFDQLKSNLDSARAHYADYQANPPLLASLELCKGDSAIIDPPGNNFDFYQDSELTNLISSGTSFQTPPMEEDMVYYLVNRDSAYQSDIFRVSVKESKITSEFTFSTDTVIIDETNNTLVAFTDLSANVGSRSWDFGNGYFSSASNPVIPFRQSGQFEVTLLSTNEKGCQASSSNYITAIQRSYKPILDNFNICQGETITINPVNVQQFRAYNSTSLLNPIFEGEEFEAGPFFNDTTIYITGMDLAMESNPLQILVKVKKVDATFTATMDTVNLDNKSLIHLNNHSENSQISWNINGEVISGKSQIIFDYQGVEELNIELTVTGENGCTVSTIQTIKPTQSPLPTVSSQKICKGESVEINPGNGSMFYFYGDENAQNLLHKGNTFTLDSIEESKMIYITGVDSLLESSMVEAFIQVSGLKADFLINSETLNLETGRLNLQTGTLISFEDQSNDASEWFWNFGNGRTSVNQNPEIEYSKHGEYEVTLKVKNGRGCEDSNSKTLNAVNLVTALEDSEFIESVNYYPNPTRDLLFLEFSEKTNHYLDVNMTDLSGKVMVSEQFSTGVDKITIDTSDYPEGIYILTLRNQNQIRQHKIVVSRS